MKKSIGILCISFLCVFNAYTQDSVSQKQTYLLRFHASQGKVINNFKELPPYSNSQYFECDLLRNTNGSKEWHAQYLFPEIGVSFLYGNLGNDSILGSMYSAYPTWYFHVFRTRKLGALIKAGVGFAYFNSPFNIHTNQKNIIIGSHITNITTFSFLLRYQLTQSIQLSSGVSFVHFSNGHLRIPNVGANDLRYSLGVHYAPMRENLPKARKTYDWDTTFNFNVRIGMGLHEMAGTIRPIGGKLFPIYCAAAYVSKQKGIHNMYVGLHAKYYEGFYNYIRIEDLYPGSEHVKSMVLSSFIGHEFLVGRWSFVQEIAQKFYNPFFNDISPYQPVEQKQKITAKNILSARIGFRYYVLKPAMQQKNNLAVGLFIKTNLAQSDYVECNVSYSF